MNNNEVREKNVGKELVASRQAQEVQAAMMVAKRFPRDESMALSKILNACENENLAEQATYEYPRGGTKVKGPSIRLAETIARNWGNIDYGTVELEQKDGESEMMAYAWDLETNTRETRIFTVKHVRDTKRGKKDLTSARDIYEMTANMGARRMRACILGVIPKYVQDDAVKRCEETIKGNKNKPLDERIQNMIDAFAKDFDVTEEQLEEKIGCNSDAFSENDLISLRAVYRSLKDGMAGVEDYFGHVETEDSPYNVDDEEETENEQNNNDDLFGEEVDNALEGESKDES